VKKIIQKKLFFSDDGNQFLAISKGEGAYNLRWIQSDQIQTNTYP
jgi:hypothetical protein